VPGIGDRPGSVTRVFVVDRADATVPGIIAR
jgi:hypothetical protein